MSPQLRHCLAFMPAVIIAAGIAVLSLMEVSHTPALHLNDKVMHGILYAALALALMSALRFNGRASAKWVLFAFLSITAYGALMEILQHYCTLTRSGDVADLLADAIGALIGIIAIMLIKKY